MTFDRVLPELIRLCEENASSHGDIAKYCVVRDVRGRVRLVVKPTPEAHPSLDSLESELTQRLAGYFVAPIFSTVGGGETQRLAQKLLEQAGEDWPSGWPTTRQSVLGTGNTPIVVGTKWVGIERTIGKEAWLSSRPPSPPWPLVKGKVPPIVTFHSFKGGVGRTTLVAAYAIRLAAASPPRRVAVVDLDVEAPGLGALLGAQTERGVLDVLVDHRATGEIDLDAASALATLGHTSDRFITVFPAGRVDETYIQKLARLDFSSTEPGADNPVGTAIGEMLKAIRSSFDVILLDSRAGLHDLAGMSLHGLAHVDVLILRGTDQHLIGLGPTLRTLALRELTRLVLVETLLPANDPELLEKRRERTRQRTYELLLENFYPEDDPPQPADKDEPHDVLPVRRKEWLDALDSLVGHVEEIVADEELGLLARRINDECILEQSGEDEQRDDKDSE